MIESEFLHSRPDGQPELCEGQTALLNLFSRREDSRMLSSSAGPGPAGVGKSFYLLFSFLLATTYWQLIFALELAVL